MTTATTNTQRANSVVVKVNDTNFVASFWRTHKHIVDIVSTDTTWIPNPKHNRTAQREDFRQWICDHSMEYGVAYDPEDRRAEENVRLAKYTNDNELLADAASMVRPDIAEWMMGHEIVKLVKVEGEEITPVTQTAKGSIVQPKYNNGNWAWADVVVTVTAECNGSEGYVQMTCKLVSGQLKKPAKIGDNAYSKNGLWIEINRDLGQAIKAVTEANKPKTEIPETKFTEQPMDQLTGHDIQAKEITEREAAEAKRLAKEAKKAAREAAKKGSSK